MRNLLAIAALVCGLASVGLAQPTVVRSFPTSGFGSVFPGGLGYDTLNDQLWVADETNKVLYKIARTGALVATISATSLGMSQPIGCGVDGLGGLVYVADESNETVWTVDASLHTVITMGSIQSVNADVSGLDYNPITNTIVTTNDGSGIVFEFDTNLQVLSSLGIKTLAGDADGLGINTFNGLYIIGDDTGRLILEMADDGYVLNSWTSTTYGINDPEGVCMDPLNGNYFISTTTAPDTIYEVAGGLTLGAALTADVVTVPSRQTVTFSTRADPMQFSRAGMALISVGGVPLTPPLILVDTPTPATGKVTFRFTNPGLSGINATLIGAAYNATAPFNVSVTNLVRITLN